MWFSCGVVQEPTQDTGNQALHSNVLRALPYWRHIHLLEAILKQEGGESAAIYSVNVRTLHLHSGINVTHPKSSI